MSLEYLGNEKRADGRIDGHIGKRLRMRRLFLNLSQEKLGDALGLTFQQIQKYERGVNRIGAGRLYDLSKLLNVPITYFFEDFSLDDDKLRVGLEEDSLSVYVPESLIEREVGELLRSYPQILDDKIRRHLLSLIKAVASYFQEHKNHA